MTYFHTFLFLCWTGVILLGGCSSPENSSSKTQAPPVQAFYAQIEKSCEAGGTYLKTVSQDSLEDESRSISIQQDSCILLKELEDAVVIFHQQDRLKDFFGIQQKGDTSIATRFGEYENSTALALQKVVFDSSEQKLRYIESVIDQSAWLYQNSIRIEVQFDEAGLYESHALSAYNKLRVSQKAFKAQIKGKRQP